jgi:hypothetical protein
LTLPFLIPQLPDLGILENLKPWVTVKIIGLATTAGNRQVWGFFKDSFPGFVSI